MVIRPGRLFATGFIAAFVAVHMGGACMAQQTAATDIWRMAPPNALLVTGYDGRSSNPSMQAIMKAEDPEAKDLRVKQQIAMRKAVEDFATLFGVSLDFAKDIESWADQQWAFVLLPAGKGQMQPVFMMASTDAAAANAALQKMLEPWQRVGEITQEPDANAQIMAFKVKDSGIEVYATASGPVLAFSPSKASLIEALKGGGFAAGSTADKAFKALSGSMFYAYAESGLLQAMGENPPLSGIALGLFAEDCGMKIRALGYPNQDGAIVLKTMIPTQQAGVLTANDGIPSTSLVAASLPSFGSFTAMAGLSAMSGNPTVEAVQALGDTCVSASLTAALPLPAGVVSAMAGSDTAAAEKLAKILAAAKQMGIKTKPAKSMSGVMATAIDIPDGPTMYLAQIDKYVVMASDGQSLAGAAASIKGEKPSLAESQTYKETMAGLGDSNLLTTYVNLAPLQGLGFLATGLGLGQIDPACAMMAKSLENVQAMGIGVGYDGDAVSATMFLRAKPGFGPAIGPSAVAFAAMGAAVAFPAIEKVQQRSVESECANNLRQLATAAMLYAEDNNGKLPSRMEWQYELEDYRQSNDECPTGEAIYAYNKNLSGLNVDKILNPEDVIMFFEADSSTPDASGSAANALLPHDGIGYFVYVDGHAKAWSEVPDQSHWVPRYAKPTPAKKAPAKRVSARPAGSR